MCEERHMLRIDCCQACIQDKHKVIKQSLPHAHLKRSELVLILILVSGPSVNNDCCNEAQLHIPILCSLLLLWRAFVQIFKVVENTGGSMIRAPNHETN